MKIETPSPRIAAREELLSNALGESCDALRPFVSRMMDLVEEKGGIVTELGIEFGAPEIRFWLPDNCSAQDRIALRRSLIDIQQEVPPCAEQVSLEREYGEFANKLFFGMPVESLEAIKKNLKILDFGVGEYAYRQGDEDGSLYLVMAGAVQGLVSKTDPQHVTADTFAGDFFGEMALIKPGPRIAGAVVAESSRIVQINASALAELLRVAPVQLMRNVAMRGLSRGSGEAHLATRLSNTKLVVAGLAHDLKNPIGNILTRMVLLRDGIDTREQMPSFIERQCRFALGLVSDFLDVTRGRSEVTMGTASMRDIVRNLEELAPDRLKQNGVQLRKEIQFEQEFPGDTDALTRALLNVLKNAVEATPNGGQITLSTQLRDGKVEITIADTGPGIAAEVRDTLFDAFTTHGKKGGTGFGMTVTRNIVIDHGGAVEIRKSDVTGTTFAVVLPSEA